MKCSIPIGCYALMHSVVHSPKNLSCYSSFLQFWFLAVVAAPFFMSIYGFIISRATICYIIQMFFQFDIRYSSFRAMDLIYHFLPPSGRFSVNRKNQRSNQNTFPKFSSARTRSFKLPQFPPIFAHGFQVKQTHFFILFLCLKSYTQ